MPEDKVDITRFPEGPQEIMKHMDYIEDDDEKMALILSFAYAVLFQ